MPSSSGSEEEMTMKSGAQFYTIRDFCKTPEDLALSLKKVADIGYTTVQLSGVCAYDPTWMDEQLRKNGLRCVITHFNPDKIAEDPVQTAQEHQVYGCRHVGIGSAPGGMFSKQDVERFTNRFLPAARAIRDQGALLMYHNHGMEFGRENGVTFLEMMADAFKKDELGFTLDTYWIQYAGGDSAEWLEALSGRVPCIHFKDMACVRGEQRMAPVGEGNLNFDRILKSAEKAGTEYILVEQDDCYGDDPFDCLKRSYRNLKALGIE